MARLARLQFTTGAQVTHKKNPCDKYLARGETLVPEWIQKETGNMGLWSFVKDAGKKYWRR